MKERGLREPVAALAVAMAALAVYALALGNDFAYDDVPIVLGDARLRTFDLRAIFAGGYWRNSDLALYRPVTTLSFALDWALAGATPAWFHLTNLLLNAAACVLVFLLLARLFPVAAALIGGLVFALHPVHVEAVANVVGRAELLAALFTFAACLVWVREDRFRTPLAGALFALALLSKESAIMLPALVVLLDTAVGDRFSQGIAAYARRQGPQVAVLGAVAVAYLLVRTSVLGALAPGRVDPALEVAASAGDRILTALQAWPVFARLLFFPVTLLADYGPRILLPAEGLNAAAATGLLLLALAVSGGAAALLRGARRSALGLLWFAAAILPVSNLLVPIGVLVAERTLYLPSFAVAVAGAGLTLVAARAPARARRAASIGAATVLALAAGRSMLRIPDWENTDAIMGALARDRPDSFRANWHAARFLRVNGAPADAGSAYDRAIALWPHRQALVIEAAAWANEQRWNERATELARLLVRQWPDDVTGYQLLAGSALDGGDAAAASQALREGLRRAPGDALLRQMAAALDSLRSGTR